MWGAHPVPQQESTLRCFLVPSYASGHPCVSNTRRLGSGCCADTCTICLDFPVLVCSGLLLCPCVPEGVYPWVSGITVATKAMRR